MPRPFTFPAEGEQTPCHGEKANKALDFAGLERSTVPGN
jgi:hypothetical protein